MNLKILIDYDNLRETQKSSGILDLVTKTLLRLSFETDSNWGDCEIRIYGGWYEESTMTPRAQDLGASIQRDFPNLVRLPKKDGQTLSMKVNAELAVSSLQEPDHHLFNTYRRKGRPNNVRVESPENVGCCEDQCPLPSFKKLLKRGRCPSLGCAVASENLVYRHEQKTVDTLLSCDLIFASQRGFDGLLLVSADDDFLPPIRSALLHGSNVIRIHPRPNALRKKMQIMGRELLEIDI